MRNIVTKPERRLTHTALVCGHCNNKAPMEIISAHSSVDRQTRRLRGIVRGETLWEMLACGNCSQISIRTGHSSPDDSDPFRWEIAYPEVRRVPRCVPAEVARAYEAGMLMRTVDPESRRRKLLGTVLEMVCWDQGAWGQNLIYQLRDLASRSLMPASLAEFAERASAFRSSSTAARSSDFEPVDIPLLEALCEAMITHIYVAIKPSARCPLTRAASSATTRGKRQCVAVCVYRMALCAAFSLRSAHFRAQRWPA